MKVVILAGGYGTRFGKLTDFLPKPMIPIGPFPMLWHIMRIYAHYGFDDFILCTGYKSELIKEFFLNLDVYSSDFRLDFQAERSPQPQYLEPASQFRPKVTLCYTGQDTMTGGRLKRVAKYLQNDEAFMLTYGDGVTNLDIGKLVEFHRSHGKIASLTAVYPPPKFGNLKLNGNRVIDFAEKSGQQGAMVNGGFYVFQREFLEYLDDDTDCVLEKNPLARAATEGQLMAFQHAGHWQCMDTTRDLELLQQNWSSGNALWKCWDDTDYQD